MVGTECDVKLSTHRLSSDLKGIMSWSIVIHDLLKNSVLSISVLAIFARRSRRVSVDDVMAHGPGLTEPRTACD